MRDCEHRLAALENNTQVLLHYRRRANPTANGNIGRRHARSRSDRGNQNMPRPFKLLTVSLFIPALILLFRNHAADAAQSESKHWAFIAPVRPPLPEVKNSAWIETPIDQFILARLEKEGLR